MGFPNPNETGPVEGMHTRTWILSDGLKRQLKNLEKEATPWSIGFEVVRVEYRETYPTFLRLVFARPLREPVVVGQLCAFDTKGRIVQRTGYVYLRAHECALAPLGDGGTV